MPQLGLKHIVFLSVISFVSFSNADVTVGQLPPDIREEIIDILDGVLELIDPCPAPQPQQVNLLLYTKTNPEQPIILNQTNPSGQIDPSKKVIFVIHGWISGPNDYGIPAIRDAYLKRYDCNLIVVDWSQLAAQLYTTSYCELPQIAELVAEFLCNLSGQLNIDLSTVHLVGHSLGAQMSGLIGQDTVVKCGKQIGRTTGLDPAGPLYQNLPASQRLDKTDAIFVDVIHSNELVFGYAGNCGQVDFHVNCGTIQNGCPVYNVTDILNTLVSVVGCNHLISMDYMAESINSDNFIAKSCNGCRAVCVGDTINPEYIIMGEDCPRNSTNSNFLIPTNPKSPYAGGCTVYRNGC